MPTFASHQFRDRRVQEWLELAENGHIALPSFQRSYVWKRKQAIEDYLLALFENRPTGIFLVLKTNGQPQFPSRTLRGVPADDEQANELLLDGQQRLTSLWQAFNGTAPWSFYVAVDSLDADIPKILRVEGWNDRSVAGKRLMDPRKANAENLVPMEILRDVHKGKDDVGPVWEWCEKVIGNVDDAPRLVLGLSKRIQSISNRVLMQRDLHYCELEADMDKETAIDIFVQSNKSSVKVNEFDIAVALAFEEGEEGLRERIEDFHNKNEVTRHYFKNGDGDLEGVIAPLGEWFLFAACLCVRNVAPKKSEFETVIKELFKSANGEAEDRLGGIMTNVKLAMDFLAKHGAPTRDTLPSLPPLHVLAGLQDEIETVSKAASIGAMNGLLSAYVWRSFLTDRYEASANARLFEDYKALRTCIQELKKKGNYKATSLPPIFDEDEYPLPDATSLGSLERPVPWIKGTSRLGRAIAAVVSHETPVDWATADKLDTSEIRKLEREGHLERHHVFPRAVLGGKFGKEAINHGLNGVLLTRPANRAFTKKDPKEYLEWILEQPKAPSKKILRQRVESHLVPCDPIVAKGSVKKRYKDYIKARAKLIATKIEELVKPPGNSK